MSDTHIQEESHDVQSNRALSAIWSTIMSVVLSTLALDQWSKRLIIDWLGRGSTTHRWEIAGKFVAFEYVENTGAAFGLLAGRVWLLSMLAIVVASTFFFLFRTAIRHDPLLRVALGLIVGGAAGNFIDRIRMGHVTDFIAVGSWPKFNIADSAITLGLVLISVSLLRQNQAQNGIPRQPHRP